MAEYLDALEVHRKTLQKQIIRARETKMLSIDDQKSELLKRSLDAQTAVQFTEELLAGTNDTETLTFAGLLLRRFEYCQKSNASLDPKIIDSLAFLPEIRAPATKDQNNIPMYGIITTQIAIPKFCILNTEGLMFLRVHRKCELEMISKDYEDRPLCHGGLTITVLLHYKDASARQVPTSVRFLS